MTVPLTRGIGAKMPVEVKVPTIGESVSQVLIAEWRHKVGDLVQADEVIATLETDKATVDLVSPVAGVLTALLVEVGQSAVPGAVVAHVDDKAAPSSRPDEGAPKPAPARVMPAADRALFEAGLTPSDVIPSGAGGRLLKEDVLKKVAGMRGEKPAAQDAQRPAGTRAEEVVPMTPLRRRVAERLLEAQSTAALLTTFNEIDMTQVLDLRQRYKEAFLERHGVKLGFMSFFVRAGVEALARFPAINAEIRGNDIAYRHYCDIGVAVGGGKGLVVPVLRNAERQSFAEIEKAIADFGSRAKEGRLKLEELAGGTFTISNGGVYGSLLSTPIVNPPQSGILGMHAIQDRPVVRAGQIVARPMMYVALTYDHRIVDGREAVSFLKTIKELVESPERLLLEV